MLSDIEIHLLLNQELHAIDIRSTVKTMGQTGVEMEALVGASVSSLAVYDMCKGVSKGITIEYTRLEERRAVLVEHIVEVYRWTLRFNYNLEVQEQKAIREKGGFYELREILSRA